MARPLGERITVLETQLPEIDKRLVLTIEGVTELSKEIHAVRLQIDRVVRFIKPALWLASSALIQTAGGPVAKFCGQLLNAGRKLL